MGSVAIDRAPLVDKLLDVLSVCQDDSCARAKFQAKDSSVLLCPFREGQIRAFGRDLMQVANDR